MNLRTLLLALIVAAPSAALAARLPSPVLDALGNANRKAAIGKLTDATAKEADPTTLAWELLYLGELKRLNGDADARALFERVAGDFPASGAKNAAVLGMAVIDARGAAAGNPRATMELIGDDGVPDTLNADRWLLIAQARARDGAAQDAVDEAAARAMALAASDAAVLKRVEHTAAGLKAQPADNAASPEQAALDALRTALRAGDLKAAGEQAAAFSARFPASSHAAEVQTAAARVAAGKAPDVHRVAALLPLTGKYAQPGASLQAAITQAAATLGGDITVQVYDTAGSPDQCATALRKAVIDDGATIVIGPLTKEEAATCGPAAQALHTAMLPLTSSADVLSAGNQIFRAYPTTEDQARALVAETLGRRNLRNYAILHPRTAYGENAARAFTAEVTTGGGAITVEVGYDPTTADFRSVAKQLSGKAFDAIFIPDTYQTVALVASAIAFQEISVGAFQTAKGPPAVPLLGLNGWHNDEIARRGGAYVQRGIFVDAFDPTASDPAVAAFVAGWKGANPPTVLDAVGYDAMLLAAGALAQGGDPAEALATVEIADGVAGTHGFAATREARRDWRLLTVTRSGVVPLSALEQPAPELK